MISLLTHSSKLAFQSCRKRYWYSYHQRLRKTVDAKALRLGSNWHEALEHLAVFQDQEGATKIIWDLYNPLATPDTMELQEWRQEAYTLASLLSGYAWYWAADGIQYLKAEQEFCLPLRNPATGRPTVNWMLAGKIDGIVQLPDGRLAIMEHKLLGESLDSDSTLWKRLRMDPQVSLYILAARELGYPVDTVIYDVCRKPTISATPIPILDDDGLKIVVDEHGERVYTAAGKPRQVGDPAKGWRVLNRTMKDEEWAQKLVDDIGARPTYYFARQEIPRLDGDLQQFEQELWDIQRTMADAHLHDRWYRTVGKDTCSFCTYFDLCSRNFDPTEDDLPEGFFISPTAHTELSNGNLAAASNGAATDETQQQACTAACGDEQADDF